MAQVTQDPQSAKKYKYLKYLGTLPSAPIPIVAKCEMIESKLSKFLDSDRKHYFENLRGDYVVTNSTKSHLETSFMKMDQPVVHLFRGDSEYVNTYNFVRNMYSDCFQARTLEYEEMIMDITHKSSSGIVENRRGLPKKGDCILRRLPFLEYEHPNLEEIPLWKVSGKVELKTRADYIGKMKQRTFIIQPFHFFWLSKKYYGAQNEAIKMSGWSYYGFNPYEGGVDRLARNLIKHRRFWDLDGKGWDRLLPHLLEVYQLRNTYKQITPDIAYCTKHIAESILLLPNGDLVFKLWGNNSGSATTTGDNILAMSFCLAHVFKKLGLTDQQIKTFVFIAIFGDDVVGSDSLPFSDEQLRLAFETVFRDLYGITLDPFNIYTSVTDLKFLGFQFTKIDQGYIPCYPLERLACSMIYNLGDMEVEAEFAKMCSLTLMSAGNGESVFNFFRDSLIDVVVSHPSEYIKSLREKDFTIIFPEYDAVIAWYLGLESTTHITYQDDEIQFSI